MSLSKLPWPGIEFMTEIKKGYTIFLILVFRLYVFDFVVYCGFGALKMNNYLEKSGGDWVFKLLLVLSPPLSS